MTRIASLTRRLIDYRTFGIVLLNEDTQELEIKAAVRYGEKVELPRVKIGSGLIGYAALHKEVVLVPDVALDPRYISVVPDVRSELVIPLLVKDRCIGVFDLESPELDAFNKSHVEILTLLASQAAVAIENARLYQTIRANEVRLEKELRFAQRVQMALLPTDLPKRIKGVDVAARFTPARELGGDLYDFLAPEPNSLVVAVGDVSGKGVPAALYSAFAGELVRSRTFRRRFMPERASPADGVGVDEHHPPRAAARGVLLHVVLRGVRFQAADGHHGQLRPALSRSRQRRRGEQVELPGVPLGSFAGSSYDEASFDLAVGDVYVFCTDGVSEARDTRGREFGTTRLLEVVAAESPEVVARSRRRDLRRPSRFQRQRADARRHDRRGRQDHHREVTEVTEADREVERSQAMMTCLDAHSDSDAYSIRRSGTSHINVHERRKSRRRWPGARTRAGSPDGVERDREPGLPSFPTAAASRELGTLDRNDGLFEDEVRDAGEQQDGAVDGRRQRREMVLAHPAGDKRNQRQPEQQVQIRPQDAAVDPVGHLQHVVMIVPVDAENHEAQHVGEEHRHDRLQRRPVGAVRHLELQHHDRDEDGDHAVAERLEPPFAHRVTSPRYRSTSHGETCLM